MTTMATIKIKPETHAKLLKIISQMQMKTGKRITMDNAIDTMAKKCRC